MNLPGFKYLWVLLFFCASCGHQSKPAEFETSVLQGKDSKVEAVTNGDTCLVTVSGSEGIGRASVRLISGQWTEKTTIRLYLKGLEGLNVSTSRQALDKSQLSVNAFDMHGNAIADKYLLNEQGYFEVQLPKGLFSDNTDAIEIQWIDFYR